MSFHDYLWKDVKDCHIKEGMLGATFTVKFMNGGWMAMEYLPKSQARQLYRYGQEREEEMAEYRRTRELEDSRARAGGGIYVNSGPGDKSKEPGSDDPMANLKKLKSLLEAELITS